MFRTLVLLVSFIETLKGAGSFNLDTYINDAIEGKFFDTLVMFNLYNKNFVSRIPISVFTSTYNISHIQFDRQTLSLVKVINRNLSTLEEYFEKFSSKTNVKHVFILENSSKNFLFDLFESCWNYKIVHVLAIIQDNIFSYSAFDSYPRLNIFEVTNKQGFLEIPSDFNNFPLKIGSKFPITKGWDFYGIMELFGKTKNINITYHIFENSLEVDFLKMNVIPKDLEAIYEKAGFSQFVSFIAALPNKPLVNKETFMLLPFDPMVWYGIIFGVIYFSVVFWIMSRNRISFEECILAALSLTLQNSINVSFKISLKLHTIILTYTLYSFLITTLHSMYLGSFLIKNTGRSEGAITCHYIIYDTFVQFNSSILGNHQFIRTIHEETKESFSRLDSNKGYCMDSAFFDSFNDFQKHLETPLYLKETSDYTEPCTYAMNRRFVLKDVLNKFLRRLYYSGLFGKLLISDLNADLVKSMVANSLKRSDSTESSLLVARDFKLVFIAFGICLAFAAVTFVGECGVYRMKH